MRLLIVTGIFPPDIGGPATYVPQVAEFLVSRGHSVQVITLSDRANTTNRVAYPYRVVRIPRRLPRLLRFIVTVFIISRHGWFADLLYVNGLALESAIANLLLRRKMVQKVVGDLAWERAVSHGRVGDSFEEFQHRPYGTRVEMIRRLRTWWTRRADAIVVNCHYLADWVFRWGVSREKIVVIYNAVQVPEQIDPITPPLPVKTRAIAVGRLVRWKNMDIAIRAISTLSETGLVVVGDGPERARLEETVRRGGAEARVLFVGKCSHLETLRLMAGADIFVLCSSWESFPHVVVEAMTLGLPVIATTVGGTPEIVENARNGILVAPADELGLRRALAALIASPAERKSLGEAARLASRRFTPEQMLQQTEDVLVRTSGTILQPTC